LSTIALGLQMNEGKKKIDLKKNLKKTNIEW